MWWFANMRRSTSLGKLPRYMQSHWRFFLYWLNIESEGLHTNGQQMFQNSVYNFTKKLQHFSCTSRWHFVLDCHIKSQRNTYKFLVLTWKNMKMSVGKEAFSRTLQKAQISLYTERNKGKWASVSEVTAASDLFVSLISISLYLWYLDAYMANLLSPLFSFYFFPVLSALLILPVLSIRSPKRHLSASLFSCFLSVLPPCLLERALIFCYHFLHVLSHQHSSTNFMFPFSNLVQRSPAILLY